jgi:hypothetical protein
VKRVKGTQRRMKGKRQKSMKIEGERDEMTAVDEKGKGKAAMMKQGRNESLLLSPLILNCILVHEIL